MVTVQHYGTCGYSSAPWDMWLEFSTKGHVVRVQEYRIHGYSSALWDMWLQFCTVGHVQDYRIHDYSLALYGKHGYSSGFSYISDWW